MVAMVRLRTFVDCADSQPPMALYISAMEPNRRCLEPDGLAVIDVKPGTPTYSQIVHIVTMPYNGDEFHHFGWNACSSALSPLTGHAFLERRYLIIPGIRSSRIYVVDTKPDPTQATIHKIIEPEELFRKTGYSGLTRFIAARKAFTSARSAEAAKMAPKGRRVSSSWTARRSIFSVGGRSTVAPRTCTMISGGTCRVITW